ncbi:MAG: TROVE domain-containing protein [Patescibacteria group bacterium]|nr:TROVE domain-containing protein [Patescibacteria group bacterium]
MADLLVNEGTRRTAQNKQARPEQVENSAGGYVFEIPKMEQAKRFLILGTTSPTYYASAQTLTAENAAVVRELANNDGLAFLELIKDVSVNGRAKTQNPTIFSLAACCASTDNETRREALALIPVVCRTGTHLFMFAKYIEQFRGWGRALRTAVGKWYDRTHPGEVAYQVVKYRNREGWTHRDLLRVCHVKPSGASSDLLRYIVKGDLSGTPDIVHSFHRAQEATTADVWVREITEHRLPWECLPDAALAVPAVWEALVPHMGMTALVRNLGRITKVCELNQFSQLTKEIASRLSDEQAVVKSKVHPMAVLIGSTTYVMGHGVKGSLSWTPVASITDALEDAFMAAFGSVQGAGKNTLLALDVSGSMAGPGIAGTFLSPRAASAAMAMVTLRSEPAVEVMAFSSGFVPLSITARSSLQDIVRTVSNMPFDRTDCAVPMLSALHNNLPIDTFVIYTDNETWCGRMHPFQALEAYRQKSGRDARLAVVGMTATNFSIANPKDPGMLDFVGFDAAAPEAIRAFSAREF